MGPVCAAIDASADPVSAGDRHHVSLEIQSGASDHPDECMIVITLSVGAARVPEVLS